MKSKLPKLRSPERVQIRMAAFNPAVAELEKLNRTDKHLVLLALNALYGKRTNTEVHA